MVKKFVTCDFSQEKMRDENFRFTLTTNGMLLDNELPEFANSEMSNVVINLDGRKNINNKVIRTHENEGTYDMRCQLHKRRIKCAIMLKAAEMCKGLLYTERQTHGFKLTISQVFFHLHEKSRVLYN